MKAVRLRNMLKVQRPGFLVLILISLVQFSCGSRQPASDPAANTALSLIPNDTPYVLASLSRSPRAYVDLQMRSLEEKGPRVLEVLRSLSEIGADDSAPAEVFQLLSPLLKELDGRMTEKGLLELGIRADPLFFLYGTSWAPIFRIELADGAKLKGAIKRVLKGAKIKYPTQQYRGIEYWRFGAKKDDNFEAAFAIVGNFAVGAAYPRKARTEVLANMFGLKKPNRSLADTGRLSALVRRHQLMPWAVLSIRPAKLGQALFGPRKGALRGFLGSGMSQTCRLESSRAIGHVPDMVAGMTSYDDNTLKGMFGFILRKQTARDLEKVRGSVPGTGTKSVVNADASLAIALKPKELLEFTISKLKEIGKKKYVCKGTKEINDLVENAQKLPLLMMFGPGASIAKLTGFSWVIDKFGPTDDMLKNAKGNIFGGTQGDIAPLLELVADTFDTPNIKGLKPNDPPVLLGGFLMSAFGKTFFSVTSENSIALSFGGQRKKRTQKIVSETTSRPPLFFGHMGKRLIRKIDELDRPLVGKASTANKAKRSLSELNSSPLTYFSLSADLRNDTLVFDFVGRYPK